MNLFARHFSLNDSSRFGEIKQKMTQQPLIGKGYDAELIELGEEIKTKKHASDESIHQGALDKKNQIAIVGLWRKDDKHKEFYCYHYFYVPNPCVREYARSERNVYIHGNESEKTKISVTEVLFKGGKDDLFMIFNTSKIDENELEPSDKNCWKLGILDLDPKEH